MNRIIALLSLFFVYNKCGQEKCQYLFKGPGAYFQIFGGFNQRLKPHFTPKTTDSHLSHFQT